MKDEIRAFPCSAFSDGDGTYSVGQKGMSLRDWFAGQALTGLLANGGFRTHTVSEAYELAASMLEERKKPEGKSDD